VSVAETILYFVVPAVGLYLLLALLVVGPRMARRPRYRAGQPWTFPALWWTTVEDRAGSGNAPVLPAGERGGARGSW
jgi:hypothetical protein